MCLAKYKVFMTDTIFPDTVIEREELERIGAELQLATSRDSETFAREGADCDAMLVVYAPVEGEVIERLDHCRIIVRTGIGVNNIDIPTASRKGIMVANVPDYCLDEVADHAMAMFLSGVRKVAFLDRRVRQGAWNVNEAKPVPRLRGKVFGLFGCGAIGQRVALRAKAFGMRVLGYDPYLPDEAFMEHGIEKSVDFDSFLSSVDFLSLHVPLTDSTHHIMNRDTFGKMKPTSFLINTSRGPLVNENDLYEALKNGTIGGAGLDVLDVEPPAIPFRLAELDNIVITPHAAFFSDDAVPELRRKAAQEIARTLIEGKPRFWVNRKDFPHS